jgi:uncharacterized protein YcnI
MRRLRTIALTGTAALVALLALAVPAAAHVTVHSTDATRGGYALLTFRVPTESDTASTTELQVHLPTDTPITSVSVQPHPGWSFKTTTTKLAKPVTTDHGEKVTDVVSEITWTADSAASAIKPGEFDQFDVSAGPLPDVAQLRFPAIQTYSDGSVVRWIETPAPGSSAEPAHPAPTLLLAAATPTDGASTAPAAQGGGGSNSNTALILSIVALVLAAGALGLGVVTRARRVQG